MEKLLITIDGPAGAGKTTVSRMLADRLGYRYIDTGALYRGVAYEVESQKVGLEDDFALEKLCSNLNLKLVLEGKNLHIWSGDTDITGKIRTPEITMLASAVSARPVVRNYLLDFQREMSKGKAVVFEGRDMGTIVFPDADIKFFLNASDKIRALRRYKELAVKSSQTLEEVEHDIKCRDKNDSSREMAPLKPAEDAIEINSTNLSVDEVVEEMLTHIKVVFANSF